MIIFAEAHHLVGSGLFFLRGVAETVGAAPHAQPNAEACGFLVNGIKTVGKLFFEPCGLHAAVKSFSIDGAGIKGVNVELHAVLGFQPCKKVEVDLCLCFGSSFVGVVYPAEVLCFGGGFFIGSGKHFFLCICC